MVTRKTTSEWSEESITGIIIQPTFFIGRLIIKYVNV